MTDDNIKVELIFGSARIVTVQKAMPDGSLLLGGYSIVYDRDGKEIRRTEPTWIGRLTNVRKCLPEKWYTGEM